MASWLDSAKPVDETAEPEWLKVAKAVEAEKAAAAAPGPGAVEAGARGALQGSTLGFGDEIVGALSSGVLKGMDLGDQALAGLGLKERARYMNALPQTMGGLYRASRDSDRAANEAAKAGHGKTYLGGEVGGGLATMLLPGAAAMKGAGGAATLGGAAGLGFGNADLTKGEVGKAAVETGLGAALGLGAHGLASAIGAGARGIANRAGAKVLKATEKARQMALDKIEGELASLKGKLGSVTQQGNRQVENLQRLALTPEQEAQKAALAETLAALEKKLADSTLESLPGTAGEIDAARQLLEQATAGKQAAVEAEMADILGSSGVKRQVMDRLKRYGPPLAGTAIGTVVGGPVGAGIGALAGAGTRPAIRSMRNLVTKYPGVQRAVWQTVGDAAGRVGGTPPAAGPALQRVLAHGEGISPALADALGLGPTEEERRQQLLAALLANGVTP